MSASDHLSPDQFTVKKNGFMLNEQGECKNCNYFKKKFEGEQGRPVGEYEEYPGWDMDWAHSHRP